MTEEDVMRLKEQIVENLASPEEVQTDSGRYKNHSVSQQIKALDYLDKRDAQAGAQARRVGVYKLRNRD